MHPDTLELYIYSINTMKIYDDVCFKYTACHYYTHSKNSRRGNVFGTDGMYVCFGETLNNGVYGRSCRATTTTAIIIHDDNIPII